MKRMLINATQPEERRLAIVEDAEMLEDIRDYDMAARSVEKGEELIPSEVVYALLDGNNPIRVWREYRMMSQQALAAAAGISPSYLSQLETGKRTGTAEVLGAISKTLMIDIDDLV